VPDVEAQPLASQVNRLIDAYEFLGEPMPTEVVEKLRVVLARPEGPAVVQGVQEILDARCLAWIEINPESRVKVQRGPAKAELLQGGWRNILVKVVNSAGVTAKLKVKSPQGKPVYRQTDNTPDPEVTINASEVRDRFLDVTMFDSRPLEANLSGLRVEYRILQVYARDAGKLEGVLMFDVGAGSQDLGFRAELPILFESVPATRVLMHVADDDGSPTTGWFEFRDANGRVYPSQTRRLAPDFFFHPQIYRADGETVLLPAGKYDVTYSRGPEYVIEKRTVEVPAAATHVESFRLKRWIHLKEMGWYSGDHHIHAAGCAHYDNPTKGVGPADMFRHCVGEDLNIGCCLSWGPCWYYQKTHFDGQVHEISQPNYLLRYDVEVSGFPSSHAGHLCLLNLKEDDYPGTERIEQWPSWDLPVLKWGKEQGGVVGFSHSGWGLTCQSSELPNLEMPKFDGIGANEFIVDVVHDACDFISAVDTPIVWELNVWYHTLNCGYRARISGETDFPCIYGDRVGLGRGYVKLAGPLTFEGWVQAIKAGRSYCCDGRTHLVDFAVDGFEMGSDDGVLRIASAKTVKVSAKVAAYLRENPDDAEAKQIRSRSLQEKPYWSVERARVGQTRRVPVELVVNGVVKGRTEIDADGTIRDVVFEVPVERSSWIALRVMPAAHTNPVFVEVAGRPIRASRASADWCRRAVDVCWEAKSKGMRDEDLPAAKSAYDIARQAYDRIMSECEVE
jgi:hypothetical protein